MNHWCAKPARKDCVRGNRVLSAGDKKCLGKKVVFQMDVALLGADVGVSRRGRPGKPKAIIVFLVFRITRGCLLA